MLVQCWPSLVVAQHLRNWSNIVPTLGERLVFAGYSFGERGFPIEVVLGRRQLAK